METLTGTVAHVVVNDLEANKELRELCVKWHSVKKNSLYIDWEQSVTSYKIHMGEKFHHDYEGKIVRPMPKGGSSTSPPKQEHVAILLRKLAKGIFEIPESKHPNTEQAWYEFLSDLK